jgi:FAD/FMN-containing dehydrogenase
VPAPGGEPPPLEREEPSRLARTVYRASAGDAYGKEFRWDQELRHDELPADGVFTRNRLLYESAEWFENRTADTTDILHEYFVPLDGFDAFIERVRAIVPAHGGNLLNVTLRDVRRDELSFLRYADRDAVALVMVFVQPRTTEGDRKMEAMTRELIDAALANGGRYYLPYRLHATPEQFRLAYPRAERFFELKRKHDPEEIFQNEFYLKYGRSFAATQPTP